MITNITERIEIQNWPVEPEQNPLGWSRGVTYQVTVDFTTREKAEEFIEITKNIAKTTPSD